MSEPRDNFRILIGTENEMKRGTIIELFLTIKETKTLDGLDLHNPQYLEFYCIILGKHDL